MIFPRHKICNNQNDVIRKIKKELLITLQKKGIEIHDVNINLQDDNLSLALQVGKVKRNII